MNFYLTSSPNLSIVFIHTIYCKYLLAWKTIHFWNFSLFLYLSFILKVDDHLITTLFIIFAPFLVLFHTKTSFFIPSPCFSFSVFVFNCFSKLHFSSWLSLKLNHFFFYFQSSTFIYQRIIILTYSYNNVHDCFYSTQSNCHVGIVLYLKTLNK